MAGRCGCASSGTLKFEDGNGTTVRGIGTMADPIIIDADINELDDTVLQFSDGVTVNFATSGLGAPGSPLVVTAEVIWPSNTVGLPLPVFTTGTRPAANTVGAGRAFWNSTTKKVNISDGAAWYDAVGVLA